MRAWPALLFVCSCGLDENGLMTQPNDASVETAADVVGSPDAPVDVQKEAGPPQACSVDAGACVANLPSGWELVAVDPSNQSACPSNYTSAPVVVNVAPGAGACDCGCTVSTQPACDVGNLARFISADNSCNQTGNTFTASGPGCTLLTQGQIGPLSAYSKSSPLAPSGGKCTGDKKVNKASVATNAATTCAVPPSCQEQFCGGDVLSGFQSCIQKSGQQLQACPAGWSNGVLAADDFNFDCSACTCDLGGTTCTNASVTFYSDAKCTTSIATVMVDGQCDADPGAGQTPLSWKYKATTNVVCNATGPKTPSNLQLVNARTICCK